MPSVSFAQAPFTPHDPLLDRFPRESWMGGVERPVEAMLIGGWQVRRLDIYVLGRPGGKPTSLQAVLTGTRSGQKKAMTMNLIETVEDKAPKGSLERAYARLLVSVIVAASSFAPVAKPR